MKPLIVAAIAVVLALLLIWFVDEVSDTGLEHDSLRVKTVEQWGSERPFYVVEPPTTTTTARARTAPTERRTMRAASAAPAIVDGAWSCGGDLPPCWVLNRENPNRDLTVYNGGAHHEPGYTGGNPEGDSTASGKWQFLRSTWNGFMGYINAADAPWEVQDEKARQVWAGGRGCAHWSAC